MLPVAIVLHDGLSAGFECLAEARTYRSAFSLIWPMGENLGAGVAGKDPSEVGGASP